MLGSNMKIKPYILNKTKIDLTVLQFGRYKYSRYQNLKIWNLADDRMKRPIHNNQ